MWASCFILQYQAVPGDGAVPTQTLKDIPSCSGTWMGTGRLGKESRVQ